MRRAFIGFSTPIGYNYGAPARRARNDQGSSPNPILYGSMGLLTLYDELWFACESLCPQSMRHLPYVKFLDRETGRLNLKKQGFLTHIDKAGNSFSPPCYPNLSDVFEGEYYGDGMSKYLGDESRSVDNHTHDLKFYGISFGGNLQLRQLLADIWLIARFKNYNFDLILNPLTAKFLLYVEGDDTDEGFSKLGRLEIAEKIITLNSLYDIVGPNGPYHECLEEIRRNDLIKEFREWMGGFNSRLDNQELKDIQKEVDAALYEFELASLRKYVEKDTLRNVVVDLFKDGIANVVPGVTQAHRIMQAFERNQDIQPHRWKAFVAISRRVLSHRIGQ